MRSHCRSVYRAPLPKQGSGTIRFFVVVALVVIKAATRNPRLLTDEFMATITTIEMAMGMPQTMHSHNRISMTVMGNIQRNNIEDSISPTNTKSNKTRSTVPISSIQPVITERITNWGIHCEENSKRNIK